MRPSASRPPEATAAQAQEGLRTTSRGRFPNSEKSGGEGLTPIVEVEDVQVGSPQESLCGDASAREGGASVWSVGAEVVGCSQEQQCKIGFKDQHQRGLIQEIL